MTIEIYTFVGLMLSAFMAGFAIGRSFGLHEANKALEKKIQCKPLGDLPSKSTRFPNHQKATVLYVGAKPKTLICPYKKKKYLFLPQQCALTNDRCTLI